MNLATGIVLTLRIWESCYKQTRVNRIELTGGIVPTPWARVIGPRANKGQWNEIFKKT